MIKLLGPDRIPVELYKAFFEIEYRKGQPGTDHPGTDNGNNKLGNNDYDIDLNNNSDDDSNHSDCAKRLLFMFN